MATITTFIQKVAPAETGGNHPRWIGVILDITNVGSQAANEIIQVLNCVGQVLVHKFAYKILTPFTATVTIDVGKGGGTELKAAFAADAAAGTTGVGSNTVDVDFTDDTVDVQILVATAATGSVLLQFLVSQPPQSDNASTLDA